MTQQDPLDQPARPAPDNASGDAAGCALAARRFTQALAWTRLAEVTARVEASLSAAGTLDDLIALERALDGAWPADTAARPRCELMWAGAGTGGLELAAFDEAGRVLLRRRYPTGAVKRRAAHV